MWNETRSTTSLWATEPFTSRAGLTTVVVESVAEIQIRTGLQDAFSVVSRAHLYRAEHVPDVVRKIAKAQADHLAVIDETFEAIKELVNEHTVSPKAEDIAVLDIPLWQVL